MVHVLREQDEGAWGLSGLDDLAASAEALARSPQTKTVAKRVAELTNNAVVFQRVPTMLFDVAVDVLRDQGVTIPEKDELAVRAGDIDALCSLADRAHRFCRKHREDAPPILICAADLLGALAAFFVVCRYPVPSSPEGQADWLSRVQAASYTVGAAENRFWLSSTGISDAAGERIFHRRQRQSAARATTDARNRANEAERRRAVEAYAKAKGANPQLSKHAWATHNKRKFKLRNADGDVREISLRALEQWIAEHETSQIGTELRTERRK